MLRPPPPLLTATPAPARQPSSQRSKRHRRADELRLRRVFELFDRDSDGVITPAELSGAVGRLGLGAGVPGTALDAVVAAYIAPGMPGLRFAEFEALHAELAAAGGQGGEGEEETMREAFGVFDEDGDGYISAAELQAVLSRMGLPEAGCMTRVEDMIAAADRDSDGRIDFQEFKAMMAGGNTDV